MNIQQQKLIELLTQDAEISATAFAKVATKYNIGVDNVEYYASVVTESMLDCPDNYLHINCLQLWFCFLDIIEDTIKQNI